MKNVLMITNQVKTYALGFKIAIESILKTNNKVFWAANFSNFVDDYDKIPCTIIDVPIKSNPLCYSNKKAYNQLKKIIKDNNIDAIYCATPIGGLLGRLLGKNCNIKKVIYAAHGLLFFKGAGLINNTVYKLQESVCAKWTDTIITITHEDYISSQKLKIRGNKRFLVHGAGIIAEQEKRKKHFYFDELSIPKDAFVLISGGFLNKNKNNIIVIKALAYLNDKSVYYIVCGEGEESVRLKKRTKQLGLENNIKFLGFRKDFHNLLLSSDCFIMPSFREGVPRSLLEAMNIGLPCIGSKTRGITELIGQNEEGGILCEASDYKAFARAIKKIKNEELNLDIIGERNQSEAKKYSSEVVRKELEEIFNQVL